MGARVFVKRSRIERPAAEVFDWHARPGALERLTPPWAPVRVVERTGGIEAGARVVLSLPVGPFRVRWVAEHQDYREGRRFRDVQVEGPFARWEHTHSFEPDGATASYLEDRIEYELPLDPLGGWVGGSFVEQMLTSTFAYRHRLTADDLATHARYEGKPLHVALTGSSGLIGSALIPFLTTGGHRVTRLVRSSAHTGAAQWDPDSGRVDATKLDALDAVVHLAGESIAGARWTVETKERIRNSRVRATRRLCESLARLPIPPATFVCASAIGYYGDRGTERLAEDSLAGSGFLADLCREWEAATAPLATAGTRVVLLRLGVVLTAAGGALARLLPLFRVGVGGRLGSGEQYMSWVGLDDVLGVVLHALRTGSLTGPVNAVAPNAVTNSDFTATLGRLLSRPTVLPVPAAAARLAFGEMADEALLASARVVPKRLAETGYSFRAPDLAAYLRYALGKDESG